MRATLLSALAAVALSAGPGAAQTETVEQVIRCDDGTVYTRVIVRPAGSPSAVGQRVGGVQAPTAPVFAPPAAVQFAPARGFALPTTGGCANGRCSVRR